MPSLPGVWLACSAWSASPADPAGSADHDYGCALPGASASIAAIAVIAASGAAPLWAKPRCPGFAATKLSSGTVISPPFVAEQGL
jgi:hypothetical protein